LGLYLTFLFLTFDSTERVLSVQRLLKYFLKV